MATEVIAQPGWPATEDTGRRGQGERGKEGWLLVLALLVVLAADREAALGTGMADYSWLRLLAAGMAVLVGLAHLVLRRVAPAADPVLLPIVTVLNGVGIVMIHRLDLAGQARARLAGRTAVRADAPLQLVWMGIGIALFVAVLLVVREHQGLARFTYTAGLAGLVLLVLPALLPARFSEVNGAKLWIRFAGLSFQPAELGKVALVVSFAGFLAAKRQTLMVLSRRVLGFPLPRARDVGPLLVVWAVALLVLYAEHDLGTALLFFGIFLTMLYVATDRGSWLALGGLLFGGAAVFAATYSPVVHERVFIWLHAFADPTGRGFQLVQGLFGLASGGLSGTGLGRGSPQQVPFASTDFIVASLGEELGATGVMALLVLYGLLISRALSTGLQLRDGFGKLIATGIAIALALEVFLVVGGVTRVIPLTGKTTPWLSYGGSSLLGNYLSLGLLARLSHSARSPRPSQAELGTDPEPAN
jgi:cell division protein FtsW (lipid II flippase)